MHFDLNYSDIVPVTDSTSSLLLLTSHKSECIREKRKGNTEKVKIPVLVNEDFGGGGRIRLRFRQRRKQR